MPRGPASLSAWSSAGCPSSPCLKITVSLAGRDVLRHKFTAAASEPLPLVASFVAESTGAVALALRAARKPRILGVVAVAVVALPTPQARGTPYCCRCWLPSWCSSRCSSRCQCQSLC